MSAKDRKCSKGTPAPRLSVLRGLADSGASTFTLIIPLMVVHLYGGAMAELFSVSEAAAIAEVSPEIIRTALEKKSVAPSFKRKTGKAVRYQFSVGDVLFMKVLVEFPFALSKEDKQSLARILSRGDRSAARWSREGADLVYRSGDIQVSVACKAFRQKVARNLSAFRWGRRRIVSNPDVMGGEPVFRGTRIRLHHIVWLFRKGIPEKEIAKDFPALSSRDLGYARLSSRLAEKPGRPRKRLAFRRGPSA
jgi:uncharacterized protein (DUF433 family)